MSVCHFNHPRVIPTGVEEPPDGNPDLNSKIAHGYPSTALRMTNERVPSTSTRFPEETKSHRLPDLPHSLSII